MDLLYHVQAFRGFNIVRIVKDENNILDPCPEYDFFPSRDLDELYEALRTACPKGHTHGDRIMEAVLDFIASETSRALQADRAITSLSLPKSDRGAEDSLSAQSLSIKLVKKSLPKRVSSSSLSNPTTNKKPWQNMTSSWSNATGSARPRAPLSARHLNDYRVCRGMGACKNCKRRKKKCTHLLADNNEGKVNASSEVLASSNEAYPAGHLVTKPISAALRATHCGEMANQIAPTICTIPSDDCLSSISPYAIDGNSEDQSKQLTSVQPMGDGAEQFPSTPLVPENCISWVLPEQPVSRNQFESSVDSNRYLFFALISPFLQEPLNIQPHQLSQNFSLLDRVEEQNIMLDSTLSFVQVCPNTSIPLSEYSSPLMAASDNSFLEDVQRIRLDDYRRPIDQEEGPFLEKNISRDLLELSVFKNTVWSSSEGDIPSKVSQNLTKAQRRFSDGGQQSCSTDDRDLSRALDSSRIKTFDVHR